MADEPTEVLKKISEEDELVILGKFFKALGFGLMILSTDNLYRHAHEYLTESRKHLEALRENVQPDA